MDSGDLAQDLSAPVFQMHLGGKIEVGSTVTVDDRDSLSLAYTPGVAEVCTAIAEHPELVHDLTWKSHTVAIVTDGTAVLGLGHIGPRAALPVMEGKALLFKQFGDVDAVPICLETNDVDEIVDTVVRIAPGFGGINLEDIAAPHCFEVERRLRQLLDIPVFHDDQHGTAVVVLAALRNAVAVTDRTWGELRIAISGAGAAGVAIAEILVASGAGEVIVCDRNGILHPARGDLTPVKAALAATTNPHRRTGALTDAMFGADVFIGVSGGAVDESAVAGMAHDAIVFALANPTPEIAPDVAARHAAVVATGRSDHPNQINNVLAFPGIFRGALEAGATMITEGMNLAAASALAGMVRHDLSRGKVVPGVFEPGVAKVVADAVATAARTEGVVRAARR